MKKSFINFIKLLSFISIIFAGFVLTSNQRAFAVRVFSEPRVATWKSQSEITVEYGGNAVGENEGDLAFFYDPSKSTELSKPVFRERSNDLYLIFEQDAAAAKIEGTFENDTVNPSSINSFQNYQASGITDNPDNCGILKTTDCLPGGDGREQYEGPSQDLTNFLANIEKIKEKENALESCENNQTIPLSFIFCPILDGINNSVGALIGGSGQVVGERKGLLVDFLRLPPIVGTRADTNQPGQAQAPGAVLAGVVGNVITIANVFYILIFLVLIFAGSLPFLNLDSYTIKKTLPKFIAAVILTQFALPICGVIVDFFNLLGLAIPNIIFGLTNAVPAATNSTDTSTLGNVQTGLGAGVGLLALGGAGVALAYAGFFAVLILAVLALIGALLAVFYVMVRFFLLYILIIISPIAFAAWVLPGTEKFFKQWWTNFIKLNAMFVTIMGLLSIAIVLSRIFQNLTPEQGGNTFFQLVAGIIPIIALILVPKTLKWTTQGMNALATGALNAANGVAGKSAKATTQAAQKRAIATASGRRPAVIGGAFAAGFAGKNPFSRTAASRLRGQAINEERKDVTDQLNGKTDADIEKYSSKAMVDIARSPNNVKNIGRAQAAVDKLLKTGNVTGVAAAQRDFVAAARSAGMSDADIADTWNRSVLAENIGDAKSLAPDLMLDAGKGTAAAPGNMNSIESAAGRSVGGGSIATNSGDYSSVGAAKIPGLDEKFLRSHLAKGRNAAQIGLDQNAVETALTNPDFQALWTDPKQRKAIVDLAAAAGWRTS